MEEDTPKRKYLKKDYLAGKLDYYIGGVVVFFNSTGNEYFSALYKEHFRHTFFSLKFCKTISAPSKDDVNKKKRDFSISPKNKGNPGW